MHTHRTRPGLALGTAFLLWTLALATAHAGTIPAPADLDMVAAAGGVSISTSAGLVAVNADTAAVCVTDPADRASGACSMSVDVALSQADLDEIWTAIQDQAFFALDSAFVDTLTRGGSWAELTVTGDGQTHRVVTQNTVVPAFDTIMLTINQFLPPGLELVYNAILP